MRCEPDLYNELRAKQHRQAAAQWLALAIGWLWSWRGLMIAGLAMAWWAA